MRRPTLVLPVLALAALLAGCGGKASAPPAKTRSALGPSERAACVELEARIESVARLVSGTADLMTSSLHASELARRTGEAQRNLLFAAGVVAAVETPTSLAPAKAEFVAGLRRFAADFGRARRSVRRNDLARASQQLSDAAAVAKLQESTAQIDRVCRA